MLIGNPKKFPTPSLAPVVSGGGIYKGHIRGYFLRFPYQLRQLRQHNSVHQMGPCWGRRSQDSSPIDPKIGAIDSSSPGDYESASGFENRVFAAFFLHFWWKILIDQKEKKKKGTTQRHVHIMPLLWLLYPYYHGFIIFRTTAVYSTYFWVNCARIVCVMAPTCPAWVPDVVWRN